MTDRTEKRSFEAAAAHWDEKPKRVRLAEDIAEAVKKQVPLDEKMDILDFGCGTGLLGLALQPLVRSVTGVDSSPAMLEILRQKVTSMGIDNVDTRLLDIDEGDVLTGKYDLVVSAMTLHHVPDIDRLLKQFCRVLKPGGRLALADLDEEGGRFHEDNHGVFHFGFDRQALCRQLADTGFFDVRAQTAAIVTKTEPGSPPENFSVFIVTGLYGSFKQ